MYQHILIATDGSDLAQRAARHGLALARALGAKVTAVTVSEPWTSMIFGDMAVAFPVEDYERSCAANAMVVLAPVAEEARRTGVPCATLHVPDKLPADGIIDTAKAQGCDLIVMASHGRRGVSRLLLGSQAVTVLTHSTVPVLVCR